MTMIKVNNLTFSYPGSYQNIFEDVSFTIDSDWKLGFVGRNGRGKTTFLNILLNKLEYKGSISCDIEFGYFPYQVEDISKDTIEIVEEVCKTDEIWDIYREFSMLRIDDDVLYRPFESLSNGERTKVLLAAMFISENKFLLLDEPTNHLDIDARKIISEYLKSKKGFILVSHDRELLDNCCDHIISINKTNIEIQAGNFSSWWNNKIMQDNFELAQNKKLKSEIKRLEKSARRTNVWSSEAEKGKKKTSEMDSKPDRGYVGHKAEKMMKRSKSIENRQLKAIEEKNKLLHNIEKYDDIKLVFDEYRINVLLTADKLSFKYHDSYNPDSGKNVFENLTFDIRKGDRVCVSGKNGCGKSTLLKILIGEIDYKTGIENNKNRKNSNEETEISNEDIKNSREEIEHCIKKYNPDYTDYSIEGFLSIGSGLKISYVSQDTSFLKESLSEFARENDLDESLFKSLLRKLDFSRDLFENDMSSFSEGQKKKVLIAKSLSERAHLYIWDEPLNYIDIYSRIQIEELLLRYEPTIIFVEHDSTFAEKIATKFVNL